MSETFIQEVEHVAVEPVRIEREHNDEIVIEGVRYSGDYFRTLAVPNADVLYAIRRDDDQVWLTVIRNANEAEAFFDGVFLAEVMDEVNNGRDASTAPVSTPAPLSAKEKE